MLDAVASSGFFAQASAQTASSTPQPPAEVLFDIGFMPVTNSILTAWVVIAILVLFAYFSTRSMKTNPSGAQNFWELIIENWVNISEPTTCRRRDRYIMPLGAAECL